VSWEGASTTNPSKVGEEGRRRVGDRYPGFLQDSLGKGDDASDGWKEARRKGAPPPFSNWNEMTRHTSGK